MSGKITNKTENPIFPAYFSNVLLEGALSVWLEHASCSNIPAVSMAFVPQPGGKLGRVEIANFGQEVCAVSAVCSGGCTGGALQSFRQEKKKVGLAEFALGADKPGSPQGV